MKVSVIGLGKLGLCTAACFAARGHQVVGYDADPELMRQLRAGACPIQEPGLEGLLAEAQARLGYADGIAEAVAASEVTVVIVPTPSMENGRFTNEFVMSVLRDMAPALREKGEFHVVDVVSTVMPGSSEGEFRSLLERETGKRCGEQFGLAYNPEFIALGSVIHNFLNPDLVLIGASDTRTSAVVRELYRTTCDNRPSFQEMSLINAEITKLSLNCFVTMKISFANELSALCQNTPGADIDAITAALGNDSRIGPKYLNGGLGFGGPCFPRDNIAFQAFAREYGVDVHLGPQVVAVNHGVVDRLYQMVNERLGPPARIALLGLSYKPGTRVIEESQSVALASRLRESGYAVSVTDPLALPGARTELGDAVDYAESALECIADAEGVVVLTPWPEYRDLDLQQIAAAARPGALLIDCWRLYRESASAGLDYLALGVSAA